MSDPEKLKAIADELDKAMKDFVAKAVPLFQEASETLNALYGGLQDALDTESGEDGENWYTELDDPKIAERSEDEHTD